MVGVDVLSALRWGGFGRILYRTFGLCRWTRASSRDDGVLVDSGRSRSVRYRGNGCAELIPQVRDHDGTEVARDRVRAGEGIGKLLT